MTKHFPILKRFRNEWPLDNLIQQYLRSQRVYQQSLGILPPPKPRNYKSSHAERQEQAKRAQSVGLAKQQARKARAREQRAQEHGIENIDPALLQQGV